MFRIWSVVYEWVTSGKGRNCHRVARLSMEIHGTASGASYFEYFAWSRKTEKRVLSFVTARLVISCNISIDLLYNVFAAGHLQIAVFNDKEQLLF